MLTEISSVPQHCKEEHQFCRSVGQRRDAMDKFKTNRDNCYSRSFEPDFQTHCIARGLTKEPIAYRIMPSVPMLNPSLRIAYSRVVIDLLSCI